MENQNEHEFTFGKDGGETHYVSETNNRQIAKLTQKVTLLSIFIPCILGILVIFLYFDITNKVGQVDSSGSAKVQSISKELEKTIATIKTTTDELEKRVNSRLDRIDNILTRINNKIKKAEKNIDFLTYSKANKKTMKAEFEKLKKQTKTIKTELSGTIKTELSDTIKPELKIVSNQHAQLVKIAEQLKARTNEIDSLKASIKTLENNIGNTAKSFVSKTDLNNSLKKQKRLFQLEIKDNYNQLTKKIALLKFANQTKAKEAAKVIEQNTRQQ